MQSPSPVSRETWLRCRQTLERRLAYNPLFTTPFQVIDWAVANGLAEKLYASLSLDHLVISSSPPQAEHVDKVVLIPKPASVELRLYRQARLEEVAEIDPSRLFEELDRLLVQLR